MGRYGRHCEQCYRQNFGRLRSKSLNWLRLQRLFRLAQRGKGHDEGGRDGLFHVKVQTADDQHFPDQANF